jgi:sugar phosphate permease
MGSWDTLATLLTDLFNAGITVWNVVLTGNNATSIIYGVVVIGIIGVFLYLPKMLEGRVKKL